MLNLVGDINISNRLEDLEQCRFTHKIILIGDPDRDLVTQYNMIVGSLFMPPYEAVMEEMDGNFTNFRNKYFAHLFSNEVQEYIALIFRALYEGKKILLFLTKDESELWYSKLLIEFMISTFGLTISPVGNSAVFNIQYTDAVCDLLYFHDLFSYSEYLRNRNETPIAPLLLQKLVMEVNPYVPYCTETHYQEYFKHLQRSIRMVQGNVVSGIILDERERR